MKKLILILCLMIMPLTCFAEVSKTVDNFSGNTLIKSTFYFRDKTYPVYIELIYSIKDGKLTNETMPWVNVYIYSPMVGQFHWTDKRQGWWFFSEAPMQLKIDGIVYDLPYLLQKSRIVQRDTLFNQGLFSVPKEAREALANMQSTFELRILFKNKPPITYEIRDKMKAEWKLTSKQYLDI